MSLILEALRKSEAERRRGQVPDLHTAPAAGVRAPRDGPAGWLWMTLAFVGALVLVLVLWLGRGMLAGAPETADPQQLAAADTASPGTASPAAASPQSDAAPPVSPGPPRSTVTFLRPNQTLASATPSGAREPQPAPPPQRQQSPAADPAPKASVAPERVPPPAAPSAVTVAPGVSDRNRAAPADPDPARPPSRERDALAGAAAPAQPEAPAPAVVAAAPAAQLPPMRLSDLPASQREQLPPLRISMHMWAPTQRFAIIDGARVSEGDRVGDAVVEAITSDGVTLAWQGQRLHLPVR